MLTTNINVLVEDASTGSGKGNIVMIKIHYRTPPRVHVIGDEQVVANIPVKFGDEAMGWTGQGVCFQLILRFIIQMMMG